MSKADYRKNLLAILSRLDRMQSEADEILNSPGDYDLLPWADELREMIVEMQAKVEEKLDQIAK